MEKHLVLVGGGHAHMVALENISRFVKKGYRVSVIGPSIYHYYSGMGPGMLGQTYSPEQIRFATKDVVEDQGGVFVKDYVTRIDPENRKVITRSGNEILYDVVSCNAGSYIPMAAAGSEDEQQRKNVYPVKPIEKLLEASEKLLHLFRQKPVQVSIVGGGPSSAEIAGNVWQLAKNNGVHMPVIRIFCATRFMGRFSSAISRRVKTVLEKRKVDCRAMRQKSADGGSHTYIHGAPLKRCHACGTGYL
ncbi:MAG: NAD(P)/FAD-dependent oxidoreductase, partial [Desulfotignum sp.]